VIHQTEYERAKNIIYQYEKEQAEQKQSVLCTLKNLELRRGVDGHWLIFKTLNGNSVVLDIENHFPAYPEDERIINNTLRRWAKEQEVD